LIQRAIEAEGMSTISISLNRRITEKVKPPRALLVGFPLGHPMGNPFDHALQKKILVEGLKQLKVIEISGTILEWTTTYGTKGRRSIVRRVG
jgi:D-proline reductase (dithiol) PrdB